MLTVALVYPLNQQIYFANHLGSPSTLQPTLLCSQEGFIKLKMQYFLKWPAKMNETRPFLSHD